MPQTIPPAEPLDPANQSAHTEPPKAGTVPAGALECLPVEGYQPQSQANVDLVNFHKQWEERVLRHLDWLATHEGIDKRWLAIGRTQLEKAFMAVNRSVFQPKRIKLPEDQDGSTLPSNQRPFHA